MAASPSNHEQARQVGRVQRPSAVTLIGFLSLGSGAFGVLSSGLTLGNVIGTLTRPALSAPLPPPAAVGSEDLISATLPATLPTTLPTVMSATDIPYALIYLLGALGLIRLLLTVFLCLCGLATLSNDRRAYGWHRIYAPSKIIVTLMFAVALTAVRANYQDAGVNWAATLFGTLLSGGYAVVLLALLRLDSVRNYYKSLGVDTK